MTPGLEIKELKKLSVVDLIILLQDERMRYIKLRAEFQNIRALCDNVLYPINRYNHQAEWEKKYTKTED